jgi:hypothetical protein
MGMADADYVGPTAARAAVLPARVVYLIADGSESGLRRAVQEASTRWGGMTEPIIPVKPGGEFDPWNGQVASLSRADAVVNVDVPPDDASTAAAELDLELIPLANIDLAGLGAFTVHPSVIGPAHQEGYVPYSIPREDAALWEVVGAGDLTAEHLAAMPAGSLDVNRGADDQVARAQLAGSTLIQRTCLQFHENWAAGGHANGPAIVWVTEPESFPDCVYFWNLRALRPLRFADIPMLIIPHGVIQHWLGFSDQFAYLLERLDQFAPDVVLRSASPSVSETVLDETASLLGLERYTGKPYIRYASTAPMRKAPFTYLVTIEPRTWLAFERTYGELTDVDVQLFRDGTAIRFTSPVTFRGGGRTLVRLSGAALEGLPRRQAVADLIQGGSTWRDHALQLTTFALNDYNFDLHIPELPEVVNALLGEATTRHQLSVKGKPGMAWLDRTDISPLREPRVFSAIRELTTPRIRRLTRELQKLRSEGAADEDITRIAASWGGRMERTYKSVEQLEYVPQDIGARVLERLCEVGWAERGLRLTCNLCGLHSFVPLPQASERATCPGCGGFGEYEIASALTVYYRLNSYLDHLSDQGILPHLISIAALKSTGKNSYFLPGIDVWFSDDVQGEADVFGVRDGQVLTGEVKTSASEFTDEQVAHDVDLSSRLGADLHIMAATDVISEKAVRKAERECEARGLGLIILQQGELLPGD